MLLRLCIVMLENARSIILHEMTFYPKSMNPVKTSNNGFGLNDYVVELTCLCDKDVTSLHLRDQVFARPLTYPVLLYRFIR